MKPTNEVNRRELRQFAMVMAVAIALMFGVVLPWLFATQASWAWAIAAGFALWGLLIPGTLKPVYIVWMRFGGLMSKITTPLIMGAIYYVVFVPVGLVMRLAGWDPLKLKREPEAASYRVLAETTDKNRLEDPF